MKHIDLLSDDIIQNTLVGVVAFALAFAIEWFIVPHVLLISRKKQLLDTPNRVATADPVSRLAGIAFLPVIMLSFWPVLAVQMKLLDSSTMTYGAATFGNLIFVICGGIPLLLMGIKDDLIGVHPMQKVLVKIIAALLMVASGNYINNLYGLFGIHELSAWVGIPLTVLFVVYTLSSFSFIDRVDGLGGILAGIATITMGIHLILEQNCPYSIMAFAMVGMLLAFLYYNFSHKKKKIFMGRTGSLTLGYLLVFMVVHYSMQTAHTSSESLSQPIILVWSVLFVPLFDTFRVFCIRLYRGQSVFAPDHNYIYNKLLDLGYSHRETTVLMATCSLVIILLNVILKEQEFNITLILFINIALSFLFCVDLFKQKPGVEEEVEEAPVEVPEHIVLGAYTIATNFQLSSLPSQQMVVNTINPHSWVTADKDEEFKEALLRSDTLVPDGVGVILASGWICKQPMYKLAGADLHQMTIEHLNDISGSVFYLGASQHTLDLLAERLHKEYPQLRVGSYSPPYRSNFSDEENEAMIHAVNNFAPDVLFVGMTAPKQEKWINAHRHQVDARMISGIGAVFDFYAGTTSRPPQWMIHCGLEWLGRLLKEPRRMWKRNFISTPLFVWSIVKLKFKGNNTQAIPEYEID